MHTVSSGDYLLFALLLIAWCILHSALISITLTDYLKKHFPSYYRFYRLLFNLIAIITLAPLIYFGFTIKTEALFDWHGWLRLPQTVMLIVSLLLFYLGARNYDARRFLGLTQLSENASSSGISASGGLNTAGILGIIRHPWYSGGILILWARPLDTSSIILNAIFTAYLIIGARLEEKKLVREFGQQYIQYQNSVSMLFPYKWLRSLLSK